jgi:AbrB family looped-hinge helix DNA binding protein
MAHIRSVTVSSKGQIVIPEEIRKELALKEGTKLVLVEKDGKVILQKEKEALKNFEKMLTEEEKERLALLLLSEKTLAKDWLTKEEDEAWKHL